MNAKELSDKDLEQVTGGKGSGDGWGLMIPFWDLIKEVANPGPELIFPKEKPPATLNPAGAPILP